MLDHLRKFFGPVHDSVKGLLNADEMNRVIFAAVGTGLGTGGIFGLLILVLSAVMSNAKTIFPDPYTAAFATMALTMTIEILRRKQQGQVMTSKDGDTKAATIEVPMQAEVIAAPAAPATPPVPDSTPVSTLNRY